MVARIKGEIDEGALRNSLLEVIGAQTMLRSRAIVNNKKALLEIATTCPVEIKTVERQGDDHWRTFAESELNKIIPVEFFPMWRFTWIRRESEHELLLTFYHMIADGRSGSTFFSALLKKMDEPGFIIPANTLFPAYENQLQKNESLIQEFKSGLSLLKRQREKRNWFTLPKQATEQTKQQTAIVSRNLPATALKTLLVNCRRERTTLSAYVSALMTNVTPESAGRDTSLSLAVDMRAFLQNDHSKDIGYLVSSIDLAKDENFDGDTWQLARDFKKTIGARCNRAEFKFDQFKRAIALKLTRDLTGFKKLIKKFMTSSLMLTNLGRLDIQTKYRNFELLHCFHLPAVHLMEAPFICLATVTLEGRMIFNFSYNKAQLEQGFVENWADELLRRLTEAK